METVIYQSKIGGLKISASEKGICELSFTDLKKTKSSKSKLLQETIKQLDEYFTGVRKEFDLPLDIKGTVFQKKVYHALCSIPYGMTWSYQDVAKEIGNVKAVRAIGNANHNNPIAIIVPCHRVIGKNGTLVGYAGGIDKKKFLLDLEKNNS